MADIQTTLENVRRLAVLLGGVVDRNELNSLADAVDAHVSLQSAAEGVTALVAKLSDEKTALLAEAEKAKAGLELTRQHAEQLVLDAGLKCEELLKDAQAKADDIVNQAIARGEALAAEAVKAVEDRLHDLQLACSGKKSELDSWIKKVEEHTSLHAVLSDATEKAKADLKEAKDAFDSLLSKYQR